MEPESALRADIVRVCRALAGRGLIAGPDGNVSARLPSGNLLMTPAGMTKGDVEAADLVVVGPDGELVSGNHAASSEVRMHVRIYRRRPDVHAVVHAHPPTATAFAVVGEDFMAPVLPELVLQMGGVPLVPYATPGGDALADQFEPYLPHHDAFLMANHGATTVGPTLTIAHQRMESLEHAARILFAARQLGEIRALRPEQAAALRDAAQLARNTE
ncbi:MAG: class II aldolase/adducin family protein [Gemmatimonadota bacterium]|nr:class II aldolase/adducin family protein [Gemmatimonadota bacterium]